MKIIEFDRHINKLVEGISSVNFSEIEIASKFMIATLTEHRNIFIAGNGGSASLANHFVTDLSIGLSRDGIKAKAISLSANDAILTAVSNDFGFEDIFSKQLACLGQKSDLLVIISSSGKSKNIVNALEVAKKIGMKTLSLVGFDGGVVVANSLSDLTLHVRTEIGEYEIVEDIHSVICHILKLMVKSTLREV